MESDLSNISVKMRNYKCFGSAPQGFDEIKPLNVIIGRNNSGKSALLDVFEYLCNRRGFFYQHPHEDNTPESLITQIIDRQTISGIFGSGLSGGDFPGNQRDYAENNFLGKPITWKLNQQFDKELIEFNESLPNLENQQKHLDRIIQRLNNPFENMETQRIAADRDIKPEGERHNLGLDSDGSRCTYLIQEVINSQEYNRDLVEKKLLAEINKIFTPDLKYEGIFVEKNNSGEWEVHLREEGHDPIALNHMGSGLKTIILVLTAIHILPEVREEVSINDFIYLFEELENNLHPALQRRFFTYLHNLAINESLNILLSTHSNVVIDLFSNVEGTQLLHVKRNQLESSVDTVTAYPDSMAVLDDLDVRASDILQSNCVIWVEGPTDRLYINKWISEFTSGQIQEGTHYQCVYYGGRILSHFTAKPPEENISKFIELLRVNRHPILVMDSDRTKSKDEDLNTTKQRVIEEFDEIDGQLWVTDGREIENYLSHRVLNSYFEVDEELKPSWNSDVIEYLRDSSKIDEDSKDILDDKVQFATEIISNMQKEDLTRLDLFRRIKEVCEIIAGWNDINHDIEDELLEKETD